MVIVDMQTVISIAEAGRRAGVISDTVRTWIDRGLVRGIPTPLGRVVDQRSLDDYLATRNRTQVEQPA